MDYVSLLAISPYVIVAGVVWAVLENLKKWKAFADWAKLGSPVARGLWALLLAATGSVGVAVSVWAKGEPFVIGVEAFVVSTLVTWTISMGGNGFIGALFNKPSGGDSDGASTSHPSDDVEPPPTTLERSASYRRAVFVPRNDHSTQTGSLRPFAWVRPVYRGAMLLAVVVLGMWGLSQMACAPSALQVQARAADALGRTVNSATAMFHDMERHEGSAAIKRATTRDEAEAGLQEVELKWKPLWDAVDSFAAAQDAWISAMQSGKPLPDRLLMAACDLKFIASKVAPAVELPAIPGFVCPEER